MANEHRNNPLQYRYACGTPSAHCGAKKVSVSAGLTQTSQSRTHSTPEEAFRCHRAYLIDVEGYKMLDGRALSPPDDGPVRVLTKPSRFGARLRGGKGSRWMSNVKIKGDGRRAGNVASY